MAALSMEYILLTGEIKLYPLIFDSFSIASRKGELALTPQAIITDRIEWFSAAKNSLYESIFITVCENSKAIS